MDLNDIIEFLQSAARSVGAEVTSPWFYFQLGKAAAVAWVMFVLILGLVLINVGLTRWRTRESR